MANFIMLARGENVSTARILAVSADQGIIDRFVRELAGEDEPEERDHELLTLVQGDGE